MTIGFLIALHLLAIAFTFWYCNKRVTKTLSTEGLKKELEELVIAFNLNAEKNISLLEEQEKKIKALLKTLEAKETVEKRFTHAASFKENEVHNEPLREKQTPLGKIYSTPSPARSFSAPSESDLIVSKPASEKTHSAKATVLPTEEVVEGDIPWEKYLEEKEDTLSLSSTKPLSTPAKTSHRKTSREFLAPPNARETQPRKKNSSKENPTSSANTLYQLYRQGNSLREIAALTGLSREEIKKQLMLLKTTTVEK